MRKIFQPDGFKVGLFFLLATILILCLTFSGLLAFGQSPTPSPSATPTATPASTPAAQTIFGEADQLIRGSITTITADFITITSATGSEVSLSWDRNTRFILLGLTSVQAGQNAIAVYNGNSKRAEVVEVSPSPAGITPTVSATPSTTPAVTSSPTTAPSPTTTPKQISIDASTTGKQVSMSVGDTLVVTLPSNASTGFSWQLVQISDESILGKVSNQYNPPASSLLGAPGNEIWTFKALKTGTSAILMEYSQPWEGGIKGANTFSVSVVVQ